MAQGISTKSARQNAVKSVPLISATHWQTSYGKQKTEQHKNRFRYGELYHLNYCKTVKEKGRTYYEVYSLQRTQGTPEDDRELSFVCLKEDGAFVSASAVGQICRKAKAEVEGLEDFHFHTLRHTYTSNLLSGGAKPKDVQELLGHAESVPQ